jgi:hypothetical protein
LLGHGALEVELKRARQVNANEARGVDAHNGVQALVVLNDASRMVRKVEGVAHRSAVQCEEDLLPDPVDAAPDRVAAPVILTVAPEHAPRAVEQAGVVSVVAPVDIKIVKSGGELGKERWHRFCCCRKAHVPRV